MGRDGTPLFAKDVTRIPLHSSSDISGKFTLNTLP